MSITGPNVPQLSHQSTLNCWRRKSTPIPMRMIPMMFRFFYTDDDTELSVVANRVRIVGPSEVPSPSSAASGMNMARAT
jgi:hypothetical protein